MSTFPNPPFEDLMAPEIGPTIGRIQEFVRLQDEKNSAEKAAQFVAETLTQLRCNTVEVLPTEGSPVVLGELNVGAPTTLLAYLMYDTAPVLDKDEWSVPPYAGEVVDLPSGRAMVARGALARRGPLLAFTSAIEALQSADVPLPVNIVFFAEGDENEGSPHLVDFVARYRQAFRSCTATFFPSAEQESDGTVALKLGAKGMLGLEVEVDGASWTFGSKKDLHWGEAAWVGSPMWRLVHALGTLASADGSNVLIEGFYDDVQTPSRADIRMVERIPFSENETRKRLGISSFVGELSAEDAQVRNLFEPSILLEGVWGSIPPVARLYRRALARIHFRVVPDQSLDSIESKTYSHLVNSGYGEARVRRIYGVPWSKVSRDEPIVKAATDVYISLGVRPTLWPLQPKTPPTAAFGLPYVMAGMGHGGNQASADEYLLLEDRADLKGLPSLMASFGKILFAFARRSSVET